MQCVPLTCEKRTASDFGQMKWSCPALGERERSGEGGGPHSFVVKYSEFTFPWKIRTLQYEQEVCLFCHNRGNSNWTVHATASSHPVCTPHTFPLTHPTPLMGIVTLGTAYCHLQVGCGQWNVQGRTLLHLYFIPLHPTYLSPTTSI